MGLASEVPLGQQPAARTRVPSTEGGSRALFPCEVGHLHLVSWLAVSVWLHARWSLVCLFPSPEQGLPCPLPHLQGVSWQTWQSWHSTCFVKRLKGFVGSWLHVNTHGRRRRVEWRHYYGNNDKDALVRTLESTFHFTEYHVSFWLKATKGILIMYKCLKQYFLEYTKFI